MDQEPRRREEVHNQFVYDETDDRIIMNTVQDCTNILEENKLKRLTDDGYTKDRTMKRVATVPLVIVEKIINDEGWNMMDPNNSDRLLQFLDKPEWSYLKTADGKVSRKPLRTYCRASTTPVYKSDKIVSMDDWVASK